MNKLVIITSWILLIAISFSCGNNHSGDSVGSSKSEKLDKNDTILSDYDFEEDCKLEDSAHFLKQFKTIKPEGFLLEVVYESGFLQNATILDSIYFCFFQQFYSVNFDKIVPSWGDFSSEYNTYPRYCFALSKDRYAVMILRYGFYSPDVIDLIVFNYREKKFENIMTLAQTFGDAGLLKTDRSWFTDADKDGIVDIITQKLCFRADDYAAEKPLIGKMSDSIFFFKGNGVFYDKLYVECTVDSMQTWDWQNYSSRVKVSTDTTFFTKHRIISIDFLKYRKIKF